MKTPPSPRWPCFVAALAMVVCLPVRAESGSVDGNFQPVFTSWTLPAYPVAICPGAQGGMVVSGVFNIVNGRPIGSVAQLGADGRLDSEFQVPVLPWTISATAALLPDGRLLIRANRLFSATPDGIPDGLISYAYCTPDVCGTLALVAVQPDGSVYAIGSGLPLGASTSPVVRFAPNGAIDPTYRPRLEDAGLVTAAIADDFGRLVLAGSLRVAGEARVRHLLRLTPRGMLDSTFVPADSFGCETPDHGTTTTARLAIQPDGRIVVAASWSDCDYRRQFDIVRLLEDGSLDTSFKTMLGWELPTALALQSDGRILVAGRLGGDCDGRKLELKRLLPDGAIDPGFNPSIDGAVRCAWEGVTGILPATGRIWIVGEFDGVNGSSGPGLAVLNDDGTTALQPGTRFDRVSWVSQATDDSHGCVFASGREFTEVNGVRRPVFARLCPDGSTDRSFEVTEPRLLDLRSPALLPTLEHGVLVLATNRPVARLLSSGALDPGFALPPDLASFRFPTDWKSHLDRHDRLVSAVVSNRVLHAFRLEANGNWDSTYQPFELAGLRPGALLLSALDGEDRLLLAGDTLTNGFGGILRLKAAGGLDPAFGPPPLGLSRILAIAAAPGGRSAVIAGGPPRPLWLSADGRTVEGAVSSPPLPARQGTNSVRGFVFDQRERLYLTLQLDTGTYAAYRLTSDRAWDRDFVVTGRGNYVTSALSRDGDWLYVAGATDVNEMRSGGLVRVSTLARPRIEIVGSSPFFGTELLLAGEAGRRHRVETSRDLRSWEAFVDLTLGEQPEWLTDWIGWSEPYRFYRLSLITEPARAESDVAGPELDR